MPTALTRSVLLSSYVSRGYVPQHGMPCRAARAAVPCRAMCRGRGPGRQAAQLLCSEGKVGRKLVVPPIPLPKSTRDREISWPLRITPGQAYIGQRLKLASLFITRLESLESSTSQRQ